MKITRRPIDRDAHDALVAAGVDPFFARLFASRGVTHPRELDSDLSRLLPPSLLHGTSDAARLLADAIAAQRRICIVADYDCDGATACAVAVRGLAMLGATYDDYLVPNRFEYGYGLTPEIVELAHRTKRPDLIVTVDNGIASIEGVEAATGLGIDVLVTDHHLPAARLPSAACIVNPNHPDCRFPSKHLAGVGVMFYVLLALRAELRARGAFDTSTATSIASPPTWGDARDARTDARAVMSEPSAMTSRAPIAAAPKQPRLDRLLDLVALGTVADVVRLDANNRRLVAQGLARIRANRMQPGVAALFRVAGREARSAGVFDLGFALGPRVNAAGRLADMTLGIECLVTDDPDRADEIAEALDAINRERRRIEATMQDEALAALDARAEVEHSERGATQGPRATMVLFDESWHQGVVGIVASRLKERFHRPVIAFAPTGDGDEHDGPRRLRGSGRSIAGLHLRDALDLVAKIEPTLIEKFGGHAMAAGLTLQRSALPRFEALFEHAVRATLDPMLLTRTVETDGPLDEDAATVANVLTLESQVWGQGFAAPMFADDFEVRSQRLVKDKHLKLALAKGRRTFEAIWFDRVETLPSRAHVVYRLCSDTWNGQSRVRLIVEHAE